MDKRELKIDIHHKHEYQIKNMDPPSDMPKLSEFNEPVDVKAEEKDDNKMVWVEQPESEIYKWFRDEAHNAEVIAIVGERGSMKTGLAYTIFDENVSDKPLCTFKHPRAEDLKGIITKAEKQIWNLDSFHLVESNDHLFILIDEPQLHFKDQKELIRFLTIIRQKDTTVILTSCETRWFTLSMEYHINVWLVKDCNWAKVKRNSQILDIVKPYAGQFSPNEYRMNKNEFIFYSRNKYAEYNQKWTFNVCKWFCYELSNPYRSNHVLLDPPFNPTEPNHPKKKKKKDLQQETFEEEVKMGYLDIDGM